MERKLPELSGLAAKIVKNSVDLYEREDFEDHADVPLSEGYFVEFRVNGVDIPFVEAVEEFEETLAPIVQRLAETAAHGFIQDIKGRLGDITAEVQALVEKRISEAMTPTEGNPYAAIEVSTSDLIDDTEEDVEPEADLALHDSEEEEESWPAEVVYSNDVEVSDDLDQVDNTRPEESDDEPDQETSDDEPNGSDPLEDEKKVLSWEDIPKCKD